MRRLIECVPNFSEGRDHKRIEALVAALSGIKGASVLDLHSDPDHNRSVVTLAGEPEPVTEAALRGVGRAAGRIDAVEPPQRLLGRPLQFAPLPALAGLRRKDEHAGAGIPPEPG